MSELCVQLDPCWRSLWFDDCWGVVKYWQLHGFMFEISKDYVAESDLCSIAGVLFGKYLVRLMGV